MLIVSEHLTFQVNNNKGKDLVNIQEFLSFEYTYGYDLPVGILKVRTTWDKLFKFVPMEPGDVIIYDCLLGDGDVVKEKFTGILVRYFINPIADEVTISLSLLGLWTLMPRVIKAWEGTSPPVIEKVALDGGVRCRNYVGSRFSDSMTWIQSESRKRFIMHVWRHSYSSDGSYLLVGFDEKGMVLADVKNLRKKKKEPWKLTTKDFEQGYIRVGVGVMERNLWQFYASSIKDVLLDANSETVYPIDFNLFYGDEKYRLYGKRRDYFKCNNVHEKYWVALERNRAYFSNKFRVNAVVLHEYYNFELFDLCYLSHPEAEVGGFYYIESIEKALTLTNKYITKLVLCRESL